MNAGACPGFARGRGEHILTIINILTIRRAELMDRIDVCPPGKIKNHVKIDVKFMFILLNVSIYNSIN